jgi:hypothetical protein
MKGGTGDGGGGGHSAIAKLAYSAIFAAGSAAEEAVFVFGFHPFPSFLSYIVDRWDFLCYNIRR